MEQRQRLQERSQELQPRLGGSCREILLEERPRYSYMVFLCGPDVATVRVHRSHPDQRTADVRLGPGWLAVLWTPDDLATVNAFTADGTQTFTWTSPPWLLDSHSGHMAGVPPKRRVGGALNGQDGTVSIGPFMCPCCGWTGLSSLPYAGCPGELPAGAEPPYEDLFGRPSYEVCLCCGFELGTTTIQPHPRPASTTHAVPHPLGCACPQKWQHPTKCCRG